MCTVLLPLGVNSIPVNKYIISYHKMRHNSNCVQHSILLYCWQRHVPQQYTKRNAAFTLQQCYAIAPQCHVTRAFPVIFFLA